jgi:oxygen-dependent protoporphyrinogen oxidase
MLLGIRAKPIEWTIQRWPNTYPQADVGHLERVAEIEAGLPAGLYVTGGAYRGLGVPDCVGQGRATARAVVERLQAHLPLQANA